MADEFTRVGSLAEIPEGELRAFDTPAGRICVGHLGTGIFALGDECTHEGCSLADDGEISSDDNVECTCHGSRFDPQTGEPVNGPAVDPVPAYRTRVVDGWIEVGGTEEE